jgi:hypothetical protein
MPVFQIPLLLRILPNMKNKIEKSNAKLLDSIHCRSLQSFNNVNISL